MVSSALWSECSLLCCERLHQGSSSAPELGDSSVTFTRWRRFHNVLTLCFTHFSVIFGTIVIVGALMICFKVGKV